MELAKKFNVRGTACCSFHLVFGCSGRNCNDWIAPKRTNLNIIRFQLCFKEGIPIQDKNNSELNLVQRRLHGIQDICRSKSSICSRTRLARCLNSTKIGSAQCVMCCILSTMQRMRTGVGTLLLTSCPSQESKQFFLVSSYWRATIVDKLIIFFCLGLKDGKYWCDTCGSTELPAESEPESLSRPGDSMHSGQSGHSGRSNSSDQERWPLVGQPTNKWFVAMYRKSF